MSVTYIHGHSNQSLGRHDGAIPYIYHCTEQKIYIKLFIIQYYQIMSKSSLDDLKKSFGSFPQQVFTAKQK